MYIYTYISHIQRCIADKSNQMCPFNFEILQVLPNEQTHVGAPSVAPLRGADDGVCWVVGEFIFGAQSLRKCAFCPTGNRTRRQKLERMCKKSCRSNPKAGAGHREGVQEALRTAQKARWRHPGPPKKHAGDTQGVSSKINESPKP